MNTRYTTVNLDVSQQGSIPSITLSQYDLGVGLSFYIMDGGLPYSEFAETDTVVLSGTKPSGTGFTVPAYYKSGNLCSFRTPQAMTTEAGTVTCEITITKVNNISVSTANFFVEVEASAHAHETVDEDIEDFSLIANQVGEYKAVAVRAAQQAAQSATDAAASAGSAEESMEAAQSAASSAIAAKDDIQEYIDDSEAWARGTRGGAAVPSTDETYENNAKYYAEQSSSASMAAGSSATEAAASAQEAAASVVGAVKYTAQSLTTEQKAQARTNIGAASPSDIPSGTVRYDTAQSLTDAQKTQAKNNIGVPSIDATLSTTGAAADAKKVGDEIADLKDDLYDTQGESELTFVVGKYIDVAGYGDHTIDIGETIDVNNPGTFATMKYAIADCVPGDVFRLDGIHGAVGSRAWAFLTSANVLISRADASQAVTGTITAPQNAGKVVINDNFQEGTTGGRAYKEAAPTFILDNVVRFDIPQNKTEAQKAQARENIGVSTSGGLSTKAKKAIMDIFKVVAYTDSSSETCYRALRDALYDDGITPDENIAVTIVNDIGRTFYTDDPIESLKYALSVTYQGTNVDNYDLTGSFNEGNIRVKIGNKYSNIIAIDAESPIYNFETNGDTVAMLGGWVSMTGTPKPELVFDGSNTKAVGVRKGRLKYGNTSAWYLFPVPSDCVSATVTVQPSSAQVAVVGWTFNPSTKTHDFLNSAASSWGTGSITQILPQADLRTLSINVKGSNLQYCSILFSRE